MNEREILRNLKKEYGRRRAKLLFSFFPYIESRYDDFSITHSVVSSRDAEFIKFAHNTKNHPLGDLFFIKSLLQKHKNIFALISSSPEIYKAEIYSVFGEALLDSKLTQTLSNIVRKYNINKLRNIYSKISEENKRVFLDVISDFIDPKEMDAIGIFENDLLNFYIKNHILFNGMELTDILINKINAFYLINKDNLDLNIFFTTLKSLSPTDRLFILENITPNNIEIYQKIVEIKEKFKEQLDLASSFAAAKANFKDSRFTSIQELQKVLEKQPDLNILATKYFDLKIAGVMDASNSVANKIYELKEIIALSHFSVSFYQLLELHKVLKKKAVLNKQEEIAKKEIEEFTENISYNNLLTYYDKVKNTPNDLNFITRDHIIENQIKITNALYTPANFSEKTNQISYQGKQIPCTVLDGEPFKMLVHSIASTNGAFNVDSGLNNKKLNNELIQNPLEFVSESIEGNIHISASLISVNQSGVFGNADVLLGFSDISAGDILLTSAGDAGTSMKAQNIAAPKDLFAIKDINKFKLSNYYNEILIPRTVNGTKRRPDYIVYYSTSGNEVYDNSLKFALAYDIPLVIIDCEAYTRKAEAAFNEKYTEYLNEKEFSYVKLIELLELDKMRNCYTKQSSNNDYTNIINNYLASKTISVNQENLFEIQELLALMNEDEAGNVKRSIFQLQNNPDDIYNRVLLDYLAGKITKDDITSRFNEKMAVNILKDATFIKNYQQIENQCNKVLHNISDNKHMNKEF